MSSKSRAAICFISDVFFENDRIVPWPKAGICRNLWRKQVDRAVSKSTKDFPLIKDIKQGWIYRRQDAKKMYEQRFPNTQLKFMKQINDQYVKKVEA